MSSARRDEGALPSPFDALHDLRREVDRLLGGWGRQESEAATVTSGFPAELEEREGEIRITVEAPGIRPEDLDVRVEGDRLIISGERRARHSEEDEAGRYRLRELRYGRFERSFGLPRGARAESIRARCQDGVLTVTIPRADEAGARRVPVEGPRGEAGNVPEEVRRGDRSWGPSAYEESGGTGLSEGAEERAD